jgi:hypothetical protein
MMIRTPPVDIDLGIRDKEKIMAAGDTTITMIGNLVDDPELRFTPSGAAVAKFRVASTPRYLDKQTNEWKDGESLFPSVSDLASGS